MRAKQLVLVTFPSFFSVCCASYIDSGSHSHSDFKFHVRNYATTKTVRDSYDFVIAGGGLAGLTIASRLTENTSFTVLVLEAGETGDAVADSINPPAGTYYNSLVGTSYDWQHKTVPQPNANNRMLSWPRGKVLGGSSAINGMYYIRPSQIEVDAWNTMLSSNSSSTSWDWNTFHSSSKKAEIFSPPSSDVQSMANIQFNTSSYGSNGNVHVSYPGHTYPVVGDWTPSLNAIGIVPATDPASGRNTGGFVSTVCINPSNWTRSYSKSGYIDPLPPRANLDILVSSTVTRIIFGNKDSNGDVIATGVEFAASETSPRISVNVTKEVILTGGTLGSPNILLHSGIGPKDVLDAAGVAVVSELPGVGQHLQDHLAAPVNFEAKIETAGDVEASGSDFSKEPIVMSFINSATAYVNASTLFDDATGFATGISDAFASSVSNLVPSQYSEVVEGYKAIYQVTQKLITQDVGQIELLLSINSPKTITMQAAIQHAFSQGRVYINSSSPFDPIIIDPQYFSHPADVTILRQGIKLIRTLSQASPISANLGAETNPGPNVATDDEIDAWLAGVISTEFHPLGTCSMLPKSLGGVVSANLQVYGLANVRVADSSIFPVSFSAHLMSPTYGVAEKASEIMKIKYSPSATATTTMSSNQASNPAETDTNTNHNGASSPLTYSLFGTIIFAAIILIVSSVL
ncbi:hypothetical protein H2248_011080 [Termitomyces sp. 'cryptogamus']|nr:hypothetical protein H2248_011080 [Termitomyces sp. 'cryptogamus']